MKKRLLFVVFLTTFGMIPFQALKAQDFTAVSPSNHTLCYDIASGTNEVSVYAQDFPHPAGALVIPDTVANGGTTYYVTAVKSFGFRGCLQLSSVVMGNRMKRINDNAFDGCHGLTSLTLGDSVNYIGGWAFSGCIGLTTVVIPDAVDTIEQFAFRSPNGSLTSVTLGESVRYIGESAFYGHNNITTLTIPRAVTYIGRQAFAGISALATLNFDADSCRQADGGTMDGYDGPFYGGGITTVNIGPHVRYIPRMVFMGLNIQGTMIIPDSVRNIDMMAFANCTGIDTLLLEPTTPPLIGYDAFQGTPSDMVVVVSCGSRTDYQSAWGMDYNYYSTDPSFAFSVTSADSTMGIATVLQNVDCDSAVVIAATAAPACHFVRWNNGSTANPDTLHLVGDSTVVALFAPGTGEAYKYWVSFTDKHAIPYTLDNPGAYLSQRALDRRTRKGVQIDSLDLPVNPAYVQAVANTGADVRYTSRWLNGLMAYLPAGQSADTIAALPFVADVTCIDSLGAVDTAMAMFVGSDSTAFEWTEPYSEEWYGYSYTQMKMHNAAAMHSAGYTGQGVLIGVMDGGFISVDTNSVMRRAREEGRIVATRNFIEPSRSVYEDTLFHGSNVLHFIGAYVPGYVMGTAMDAQFALCVTEDWRIENVTEEYNMVAALEFLDSLGADIVNASLGYSIFVPYERRDGQTEVASVAGNIAAAKGMAFVVAAGNTGHLADYHIGVPADAEYVFTVGAVAADSTAAFFTSIGPTADGRTKPDAASYGHMVTHAQYDGRLNVGSGTSYATPILCGLMACVLQQHPEYTPYQLYDTIRSWGHMADNPNDTLGYGIPDFSRSLRNLTGISTHHSPLTTLQVYPNPATGHLTVTGLEEGATVQILDIYGSSVSTAKATRGCTIDVSALSPGTYLIRATGERGFGTTKFIKR